MFVVALATRRIRNAVHIGSPSQIVAVAAYLHNLAIEFYAQKQNRTAQNERVREGSTAGAQVIFLARSNIKRPADLSICFLLIN